MVDGYNEIDVDFGFSEIMSYIVSFLLLSWGIFSVICSHRDMEGSVGFSIMFLVVFTSAFAIKNHFLKYTIVLMVVYEIWMCVSWGFDHIWTPVLAVLAYVLMAVMFNSASYEMSLSYVGIRYVSDRVTEMLESDESEWTKLTYAVWYQDSINRTRRANGLRTIEYPYAYETFMAIHDKSYFESVLLDRKFDLRGLCENDCELAMCLLDKNMEG